MRSLQADNIQSRLALCALYAANDSGFLDSRLGVASAEEASDLVRRCWSSRALNEEQAANLQNVFEISTEMDDNYIPVLGIQCALLHRFSQSAPQECAPKCKSFPKDPLGFKQACSDCADELCNSKQCASGNFRRKLSRDEEIEWFGVVALKTNNNALTSLCDHSSEWCATQHCQELGYLKDLGDKSTALMSSCEEYMESTVSQSVPTAKSSSLANIQHLFKSALGQQLVESQIDSWNSFQKSNLFVIQSPMHVLIEKLSGFAEEISKLLGLLEFRIIAACDTPNNPHFLLLRYSNDVPIVNIRDFPRILLKPCHIMFFNPHLSSESCKHIHAACVQWAELCVMEDRLRRLLKTLLNPASGNTNEHNENPTVVKELLLRRRWSSKDYPEWLVFELEQGIQIWNEQYDIIAHLLRQSSMDRTETASENICQLNMGLGKTRVVIPCLILALTKAGAEVSPALLRVYFLSEILDEGFKYLHQVLTASILNKRLYYTPFHRKVSVSTESLMHIRDNMLHCIRSRGAIILAPEHRLSYLLRRSEVGGEDLNARAVFDDIESLCSGPNSFEIFDECDEIFSHKRQLVYATGKQSDLVFLSNRAAAVQMILQLLSAGNSAIDSVLGIVDGTTISTVCSWRHSACGAYRHIRLLKMSHFEENLKRVIFDSILFCEHPEFEWLQNFQRKHDEMRRFVLDADKDFPSDKDISWLTSKQRGDLLILRGLFSHGVLFHCLRQRNREHFGINRSLNAKNSRLAVPFVGSDQPNPRTEFAHAGATKLPHPQRSSLSSRMNVYLFSACALMFFADIALTLTSMAYYEDGLTQDELREALQILLEMGESARNRGYSRWLRMGSVDNPSIDSVTKLDLKNAVQFEVLYRTFCLNMACIEFWLKHCVLCRDAKVYETSIMASTWFLDSGSALGFSGTNDCSKMLPLHISERRNPDCRLHGVNGEMIEKMINVCELKQFPKRPSAGFCEEFAEWCVKSGFDAIIDRGAYFAGWSNEKVCNELVRFIGNDVPQRSEPQKKKKRGVVYYENGDWVLVCVQTRTRTSLGAANVHVHDTIVYFDQCRCRGVDVVLARKARAVLTMGSDTRKAEFMQAAGRMRGLDFGACEAAILFFCFVFLPHKPQGKK